MNLTVSVSVFNSVQVTNFLALKWVVGSCKALSVAALRELGSTKGLVHNKGQCLVLTKGPSYIAVGSFSWIKMLFRDV